jgi:hypothetical protein
MGHTHRTGTPEEVGRRELTAIEEFGEGGTTHDE